MQITLRSRLSIIAVPLAADLERELGATVRIAAWEPGGGYMLRYRPMPAAQLQRVLDCLGPMTPACKEDAGLEDADLELQVGWEDDDLRSVGVYFACEDTALAAELAPLVTGGLGMTLTSQAVGLCGDARFDVEDAVPAGARDALAYWLFKARGVKLRPRVLSTIAPGELQLRLPDPRATGPVQARVSVMIETDDVEAAATLRERIVAQGFTDVSVGPITREEPQPELELDALIAALRPAGAASRPVFRVVPGALGRESHGLQLLNLRSAIQALLAAQGVDTDRYPLLVDEAEEWGDRRVRIVLPIGAARGGSLRAYGGGYPERFSVKVRSDDPAAAARLAAALKALGHTGVSTDTLDHETRLEGFRLKPGSAGRYESIATPLAEAVRAGMLAARVPRGFALAIDDGDSADDEVVIQLPIAAAVDGSLLREIMDPSRYTVKVYAPDPDLWRGFTEELEAEGWSVGEPEAHEAPRIASIHVGGAPDDLVEPLVRRLRERLGKSVRIRRQWGPSDCDVWLYLPSPRAAAAGAATPAGRAATPTTTDAEAWFRGRVARAARPRAFIERTGDQLRVGDVTLPCAAGSRHRLAPDPAAFAHYTLDAPTAGTLQHLALSVRLREPALLEGETSTSKTSSILYLAALLNRPVIRLNLNGQTDTSELIGRYVPAGPGTRGWHWQDGLLVQGMKQGFWVILDELNLAEPQVIERLNPVLEAEPSLVLTEGDGSVIGAGGNPVHPEWRIFATQNPAAYAGRMPLSPAARDRWRAARIVPRPTQREYYAMLRRAVFGEQPALELQGLAYRGAPASAEPGPLTQVPGIGPALRTLATLHASLEEAGAATESGARRGERQVYTRRSLLSVLGYLHLRAREAPFRTEDALLEAVREAVVRYYVERVPAADRAAVLRLAEAAGLAPREWGAAA
jgi:MoxR-like ATPase